MPVFICIAPLHHKEKYASSAVMGQHRLEWCIHPLTKKRTVITTAVMLAMHAELVEDADFICAKGNPGKL